MLFSQWVFSWLWTLRHWPVRIRDVRFLLPARSLCLSWVTLKITIRNTIPAMGPWTRLSLFKKIVKLRVYGLKALRVWKEFCLTNNPQRAETATETMKPSPPPLRSAITTVSLRSLGSFLQWASIAEAGWENKGPWEAQALYPYRMNPKLW